MDILNKVEKFVTEIYSKNTPETFFFHDINHTREVVEASKLIGGEVKLSIDELEILLISAWFHDVGYTENYEEHEELSIRMAKEYLFSEGYDSKKIESVVNCIAVTKIPQTPQNNMELVLCDADMFHLSQDDFMEKTLRLRDEIKSNRNSKLKKRKYFKITANFFQSHSYQTKYGKDVLSVGKQVNADKIQKILDEKVKDSKKKSAKNKLKKTGSSEKAKLPLRGVETMFRLTARNQISLSSIADNKANILITVNSIILSIIVSMLFTKFNDYPYLIIPTLIFSLSSLTTIVFAILTTRPKISSGTFTKDDIRENKVNLLFFGNFYKMSLDEYDWAIKEMMKDFDGLYSNMIKDQYNLGIILAKKYIRLRLAYNIFMFGIIITVLVFLASILLFSGVL